MLQDIFQILLDGYQHEMQHLYGIQCSGCPVYPAQLHWL